MHKIQSSTSPFSLGDPLYCCMLYKNEFVNVKDEHESHDWNSKIIGNENDSCDVVHVLSMPWWLSWNSKISTEQSNFQSYKFCHHYNRISKRILRRLIIICGFEDGQTSFLNFDINFPGHKNKVKNAVSCSCISHPYP